MLPSEELIALLTGEEVAAIYRLLPEAYSLASDEICTGHDAVVFAASQWPEMFGRALLMRGTLGCHRDLKHSQKYLGLSLRELAIVRAIARRGIEGLLADPLPYVRWRRVDRCIQYCERAERLYLSQISRYYENDALIDAASLYRYTRRSLLSLELPDSHTGPLRNFTM